MNQLIKQCAPHCSPWSWNVVNKSINRCGSPLQTVEMADSDLGGCKLASAAIAGQGVYGWLKFESGEAASTACAREGLGWLGWPQGASSSLRS